MICLIVKIRFGDHEIAKHGSRNMRYLFLANMRASKQFNSITQSILLNEILKMMILLLRLLTHLHTYTLTYTHIEKLYNYYI